MPKVSVIVPVYNSEMFLSRCLDSILSQSLQDIEVICVDDGSTDNSIDVLNGYSKADSRVRVIRQRNKRQGGARNTGLEAASGEWIGFVDSDDWIAPDFYSVLYDAALRSKADMVCCSLVKIRPYYSKYEVRYEDFDQTSDLQRKFALCKCPPHFYTMNKIYRRSMLEDNRIRFREYVVFEDIGFLAEAVYHASSVAVVPDMYYSYMYNGLSTINSRQTPQKQLDRYNARKQLLVFADEHGIEIPYSYRNIPVRSYGVGPLCLLKIKERDGVRQYRLFDFLPLYRKRV